MENIGNNNLTTDYIQGQEFIRSLECPRTLSICRIRKDRQPTLADWKEFQGGMPKVTVLRWDAYHRRPISYMVDHDYMKGNKDFPNGPKVPTSGVMLEDDFPNPTVFYKCDDGREVEFPAALVWRCHGGECLKKSKSFGYGYR